jgi:hypothetical protein
MKPIVDNIAKNLEADIWSYGEKQVVLDANTRKDAIAKYREKYPDSPRSEDAIGRRFYAVHPDKRDPKFPWSNEEDQPILDAGTVDEAVAGYQKLFPESKRTIPAIKREWYELRPEKRGLAHRGRKKGGTNKTPLPGTAREKYLIPFSSKQDKKAYDHSVWICKKYGKPYAEAVKLEGTPHAVKYLKETSEIANILEKPPKKIKVAKPPRELKKPAKSPVKVPVKAPIKVPDPVKSEAGFTVGQNVIHNGSNSSPYFRKVGKIVDIVRTGTSSHLMIRFGSQNTILLSPQFIMPAASSAAAGES